VRSTFALSRYENVGYSARTHLDIQLADGTYVANNVMCLRSNGNIGINTTAPTEKLHVAGNAIVTGNLNVGSVNFTNNSLVALKKDVMLKQGRLTATKAVST
jgi:hypothetical protein